MQTRHSEVRPIGFEHYVSIRNYSAYHSLILRKAALTALLEKG